MGLRPLGKKWTRRISRATGLILHWANGSGGYVHNFTTTGHRHGRLDLKAYTAWRRAGHSVEDIPADAGVWVLDPPGTCPGFSSCEELGPLQAKPSLEAFVAQKLQEGLDAALAANPDYTCLLCGQHLVGHDQDACDGKMNAWRPTGILGLGPQ